MVKYLLQENDLGQNFLLLRKFSLSDFSIDEKKFLSDIKPTFKNLPEDRYERIRKQAVFLAEHLHKPFLEVYSLLNKNPSKARILVKRLSRTERREFEGIKANRYRTVATFRVDLSKKKPQMKRIPTREFIQYNLSKSDWRSLPRYFNEASSALTGHPEFKKLIIGISREIENITNKRKIKITVHQVLMKAHFKLPEGIHRDGCKFIVSAIPVILKNVKGGVSSVYDPNKRLVFRAHLKIGEGLFHDDRYYFHSISDIKKGIRGTIGIDIDC